MNLSLDKANLRKELRKRRQFFVENSSLNNILTSLYQNFFSLNLLDSPKIIGGYWAIGYEVPLLPLFEKLYELGHTIALPKVVASDKLMEFKKWTPDCRMQKDFCGVPFPADTEECIPEILLVPLLGFDTKGGRLGQGMGYYDAFIEKTRAKRPICTIGIAYEIQKIQEIPLEPHDQRLNYIITEKNIYPIQKLKP